MKDLKQWEKRFDEFWDEQAGYPEVKEVHLTRDQIIVFVRNEIARAREEGKKEGLKCFDFGWAEDIKRARAEEKQRILTLLSQFPDNAHIGDAIQAIQKS